MTSYKKSSCKASVFTELATTLDLATNQIYLVSPMFAIILVPCSLSTLFCNFVIFVYFLQLVPFSLPTPTKF